MPKGTLIVRPKSAQLAHDTEAFGKMVILLLTLNDFHLIIILKLRIHS